MKKQTDKQLIKNLREAVKICQSRIETHEAIVKGWQIKNKQLEDKLNSNLLRERIELCKNIGQLTEAVAKAIQFVVTKEQM